MAPTMQRPHNSGKQSGYQPAGEGNHRQPVETLRFGSVSLSIFENESNRDGQTNRYLRAKVDKRYRDNQSGEWKSTNSYSVEDLLLLRSLIDRGVEFMLAKSTE